MKGQHGGKVCSVCVQLACVEGSGLDGRDLNDLLPRTMWAEWGQ